MFLFSWYQVLLPYLPIAGLRIVFNGHAAEICELFSYGDSGHQLPSFYCPVSAGSSSCAPQVLLQAWGVQLPGAVFHQLHLQDGRGGIHLNLSYLLGTQIILTFFCRAHLRHLRIHHLSLLVDQRIFCLIIDPLEIGLYQKTFHFGL